MRVSVDANVVISFLISPESESPPARIIRMALQGRYHLCLSTGLIEEVIDKIRNKRDLARRIPPAMADEFFDVLATSAEIMRTTSGPYPARVRDPDDDYLVDHAIVADVDYLVTGDKDLLEFRHSFRFRTLTPAEFVQILDANTDD